MHDIFGKGWILAILEIIRFGALDNPDTLDDPDNPNHLTIKIMQNVMNGFALSFQERLDIGHPINDQILVISIIRSLRIIRIIRIIDNQHYTKSYKKICMKFSEEVGYWPSWK